MQAAIGTQAPPADSSRIITTTMMAMAALTSGVVTVVVGILVGDLAIESAWVYTILSIFQ